MTDTSGRLPSYLLVALQGAIFVAIGVSAFLPGPLVFGPDGGGSWWAGAVLILVGALGMYWSGKDLGRALTPMPTPNGAGLAAGGIYGHVRHPMYSAVFLVGLGLAVGSGKVWTLAFALVLAVFFEVKSRVEEAYLMRTYAGYRDYAARTGKFVPGLGRRKLRSDG